MAVTRRAAVGSLLLASLVLLASGFAAQDTTDLQITETVSPAQQTIRKLPGANITWTMVVTNNGPLADTNVQLDDSLPNGNAYVSYSTTPPNVSCAYAATFSCNLGTLQGGDSVTIDFVTTPTTEGQFVNAPTVSGDLAEPTLTNNTAAATAMAVGC